VRDHARRDASRSNRRQLRRAYGLSLRGKPVAVTDLIDIPTNINRGLSAAKQRTMLVL